MTDLPIDLADIQKRIASEKVWRAPKDEFPWRENDGIMLCKKANCKYMPTSVGYCLKHLRKMGV